MLIFENFRAMLIFERPLIIARVRYLKSDLSILCYVPKEHKNSSYIVRGFLFFSKRPTIRLYETVAVSLRVPFTLKVALKYTRMIH